MKEFEIYIAYVPFDMYSGKMRPVLIADREVYITTIYNITTQYAEKSPEIRAKYLEIIDWKEAGLNSPSYIDVNAHYHLYTKDLKNKTPIGELSKNDKERLIEFLNE